LTPRFGGAFVFRHSLAKRRGLFYGLGKGSSYMSQAPVSKISELVDFVNKLHEKPTGPTDFELARLDQKIREIADSDIAAHQLFRGCYYALRNDLPNTRKWFEMASRTAPGNTIISGNYVAALSRFGLYDEAVALALEVIRKGDNTPEALNALLRCAYDAGDTLVLSEWLPKFEKLTGKPHVVAAWIGEDAEDEAMVADNIEEWRKGPYTPFDELRKELGL
jgi:hypothetical protein